MYPSNNFGDRKSNNRQFQEAATQRKAANDTQFFWDLVARQNAGHSVGGRKLSKPQEEHFLFHKKSEEARAGIIDDNIPVQRSGPKADEINALDSFESLKDVVPPSILRCIEILKFENPTPIQKHAIPLGLATLDLMCCAQTGSGKTLAFLIPVITAINNRREEQAARMIDSRGVLPKAIILAPTRELASQIHLDARRLTFGSALRSVCVYGGNDIRNQLVELCIGADLIVATPGRLNDLVDRGIVSLSEVSFLVLDEADRMLDMGFEPQIRRIVLECDMPGGENRQTFMFSATFPPEIQTLAREFLRNYVWIAVGRVGSTVENIKQQVLLASADPQEKIKLLMSVLDQTDGRTLIFVQKRKTASWLCDTLRNMFGIAAEEIHGDRSQAQRESALKAFRDGNIRILVATDVAARGLDVPAVMHVIQFDMPLSSEDFDVYVHRIGRTGRAGMSGLATSFFVPGREVGEGNGKIAQQLLRLLRENNQDVPDWLENGDDVHSGYHGQQSNRRNAYGNSGGQRYNSGKHGFGYTDFRSNQQNVLYQGNNYYQRNNMQSDGYNQTAGSRPYSRQPHLQSSGQSHNRSMNSYSQGFYPQYNQLNSNMQPYHTSQVSHQSPYSGQQPMMQTNYTAQNAGYYDPYVAAAYMSGQGGSLVNGTAIDQSAYSQTIPMQQPWMVPNNSTQLPVQMHQQQMLSSPEMDRSAPQMNNYMRAPEYGGNGRMGSSRNQNRNFSNQSEEYFQDRNYQSQNPRQFSYGNPGASAGYQYGGQGRGDYRQASGFQTQQMRYSQYRQPNYQDHQNLENNADVAVESVEAISDHQVDPNVAYESSEPNNDNSANP